MKENSLYDIEYFQKIKNAQKIRQKRSRRKRIFLICAALLIIGYLVSPLSRINSITIMGNERYSDTEIKNFADIETNEFTFLKPKFLIESKLNHTNFFSDVDVDKDLLGNVRIRLQENKLLFYINKDNKITFFDEKNNTLTFDDNKTKKYRALVTELYSNLDEDLQIKLVEKLGELDVSVLNEISQIIHKPKSFDQEHFRFVMSGPKKIFIDANIDYIVRVGANYHNFARNTNYRCTIIEYIDTENKAIVRRCK